MWLENRGLLCEERVNLCGLGWGEGSKRLIKVISFGFEFFLIM